MESFKTRVHFIGALIFFLLAAGPWAPAGVKIEEASDRQYLPKILKLVENSKSSIDVSMYQILLPGNDDEHPVAKILKALADAHGRGVKVRVLLNRHYDYVSGETLPLARSLAAYEYLTAKGIEVVFAHSSRRLHDKVIVIDGRWVIEGSMNWTKTALTGNWESVSVIDSVDYAAAKLARIRAIPLGTEKSVDSLGDEGPVMEIPAELLTDEKYFPDMVEDKDERTFEFYLWLVKESQKLSLRGRPTDGPDEAISEPGLLPRLPDGGQGSARNDDFWLKVTDPTLFRVFRLDPAPEGRGSPASGGRPAKSQKDKRREAVRLLKKLEKQELIELKIPSAGADAEVALKPLQSNQNLNLVTGNRLLVTTFTLPLTYFTFNLPARLPLAGEFVYLMARREMAQSPSAPWWWRPQEYLTSTYHIHHTTLAAGMLELQRENIIEIVRDDAPAGRPHSERLVNRYRINRLTDPAEREAQFQKLREKNGAENFDPARRFADSIDEPNDPLVIATILKWMEAYPAGDLDAAFKQVARYERNNPRRSLYYIRGILEGMKN